jgi:glutamate dehydrogenase
VHAELAERLQLDRLLARIIALPRDDEWRTMARAALRDDLHAVHIQLVDQVLASGAPGTSADERLARWEKAEAAVIERVEGTLTGLVAASEADLARLQVALRLVRTLVGRQT